MGSGDRIRTGRLADMSLPAEERGRKRKRKTRVADPVSKQMSHARSPAARRWAREGEEKIEQARRAQLAADETEA